MPTLLNQNILVWRQCTLNSTTQEYSLKTVKTDMLNLFAAEKLSSGIPSATAV